MAAWCSLSTGFASTGLESFTGFAKHRFSCLAVFASYTFSALHLFTNQKTFHKTRVKHPQMTNYFSKLLVFTKVNVNQIVHMIIHALKMCCILNPFFTEMPTRRGKKEVPSQRAVPPVQLSHQPLKQISDFVCLFRECKLTLMFTKCFRWRLRGLQTKAAVG